MLQARWTSKRKILFLLLNQKLLNFFYEASYFHQRKQLEKLENHHSIAPSGYKVVSFLKHIYIQPLNMFPQNWLLFQTVEVNKKVE